MITLDKENVRIHPDANKAAIKNSLSSLGAGRSILIDADDVLIAGNGVYEQAEALGIPVKVIETNGKELIAVKRTDLNADDERRVALAIADNRLTDLSEFDDEALNKMLDELSPDMQELAGYAIDPNDLMNEGNTDEDEVPEVTEATCKLGDLWILGNHRLLCGDSTDKEQVEKLMDGEKADMVFTDPPYGIDVVGDKGNIGGDTKSAPTTKFRKVIGDDKEFEPLFCLDYADKCFLWGGNFFAHKLPKGGRWFVWDKNRPEGLTLSDCELAWSNIEGVKIQKFKCTWDGYHKEGESGPRVHPNQKPIKLLVDVLDELGESSVLDLFLGSGSTLIACEKTNRSCYGMELDPHYCDVIIKRWEDYTGESAVLDAG